VARLAAGPGRALDPPVFSVVVPARDAAAYLPRTLGALLAVLPPAAELIVSDDGSHDASAEIALALGARVVRGGDRRGAAGARNRGAAVARGTLLVFVDADVEVHADTLARLLRAFDDPEIAAAFGSYDADPPRSSAVGLYKNLAHHFVHQRSREEASTFWSGCGAIRTEAFAALGGFDPRVAGIEDVELGYRLRESGRRIRLVRDAQARHLKEWTFSGWLASDATERARPWARLVRAGRGLPRDLNFRAADRLATLLTLAAAASAAVSPFEPRLILVAVAAAGTALALDRALLAFFARQVSVAFAGQAAALQMLHRLAGVAGFAMGWLGPKRGRG
jgi:GT2 family glycosyltransferase